MDAGGVRSPGLEPQGSPNPPPPGTSPSDVEQSTFNLPSPAPKPSSPTVGFRLKPSPKGVEIAKKRLRAFSIQKKTPLTVPKPLTTTSGPTAVLIGKLSGIKVPPPKTDDEKVENKKPPKPRKPGDIKKAQQESYMFLQQRTLSEIEDMKRKMELIELGIPLGLICPSPTNDKAMPTKAMPPIKSFLNPDKVDEIIREAKKAKAEGKMFKFDYQKLLPDYDNPFQNRTKKEEAERKTTEEPSSPNQESQEKDKDKYNRQMKKETYDRERRHYYSKEDRDKRRDDLERDRYKEKSKSKDRKDSNAKRQTKLDKKKSDTDAAETDVNLNDYLVCDSWSLDNEDKTSSSSPVVDDKIKQKPKEVKPLSTDVKEVRKDEKISAKSSITKPKIKLKPVVDTFNFEIDPNEEEILDIFNEDVIIQKFAKLKPEKDELFDSPIDMKLFDFDSSKDTSNDALTDDTFLESVINEIKQEKISDEEGQDKGLVEYDSPTNEPSPIRSSVTPELDDRMRNIQSSKSNYSDGYRSTESGYKSSASYKSNDSHKRSDRSESKSSDYKSSEYKSGEIKSSEYKSGEYKSGEYKSGENKYGESKSSEYKTGEFKSSEYKSGDYKSGEYKSGEFKTNEYKSGKFKTSEPKSGEYNSGDYKSGEYKSGEFKTSKYKSGEYKSGEFKSRDRSRSVDSRSDSYRVSTEKERVDQFSKATLESLETWSFVLKICQPLLFRHDKNKCYRETHTVPKLWYAENPKLCACVEDRAIVYEELEICKMGLVDRVYGCDQIPEAELPKSSSWYPRESQCVVEASACALSLSSEWEADDSQTEIHRDCTPLRGDEIYLDREYQRFMQAVWPEVSESKSETPRSTTPIKDNSRKKKIEDKEEDKKKSKKMKLSSEGWSQESEVEDEEKSKKMKVRVRKRRRSSSSSSSDSEESTKRRKAMQKKEEKKAKTKLAKRRKLNKKVLKKLKETQKKKKKHLQEEEDDQKATKKKEKKLKKKKLQKKKKAQKKKAKAKSSSSSSSSSSSETQSEDEKRKKNKKSQVKKKKRKQSSSESTQSEEFDENILNNIKTERLTDDEKFEFSPRRQKPREIINVKELQNDFVGNNIHIKQEVIERDKKREENDEVKEEIAEEVKQKEKKDVQEKIVEERQDVRVKEPVLSVAPIKPVPRNQIEDVDKTTHTQEISSKVEKSRELSKKEEKPRNVPVREESCEITAEVVEDERESIVDVDVQYVEEIQDISTRSDIVFMDNIPFPPPTPIGDIPFPQSTPIQILDESNLSQTSSQESAKEIYEKDESHLRPSSQNSNYNFNDVITANQCFKDDKFHEYESQGSYEMYEQMAMEYQHDVSKQLQVGADTSSTRSEVSRIETVVRARGRGEIKCDWRAEQQQHRPAPHAHRPSRWGLKPGEVNIVLTGGNAEQHETPAQQPVYQIQSIANNRSNNNSSGSYDEAYEDMYGASDRLQYGDCFNTDSTETFEETPAEKPQVSTLDDRINQALKNTVLGEVAKCEDETEDKDGPEKGILMTCAKPLSDPRSAKRVSFADGYKPGQDSDVEEPPIKRKKKPKRVGCAWPCPATHPDHVPLWDALPPPPPPPGSPPPPHLAQMQHPMIQSMLQGAIIPPGPMMPQGTIMPQGPLMPQGPMMPQGSMIPQGPMMSQGPRLPQGSMMPPSSQMMQQSQLPPLLQQQMKQAIMQTPTLSLPPKLDPNVSAMPNFIPSEPPPSRLTFQGISRILSDNN